MMTVVQKPFVGKGESYIKHQLIDSSVFRNEQTLINQRFLRPATAQEIESARFEDESEPEPASAPTLRIKKRTSGLKLKRKKR